MRLSVILLGFVAFLTACSPSFSIFDTIPSPPIKYHDAMPDESGATQWTVEAYRIFCREKPNAVACAGNSINSKLSFDAVYAIDVQLRGRFVYNSDWSLYHIQDKWENWVISGDCEDYALTLSELLSQFGESSQNMRLVLLKITTVFGNVGHAMLAVKTSDKGWVIIGVNPDERPIPGTDHKMMLPDRSYHPMVKIYMDGSQKVVSFPGYIFKNDIITDGK